MQSNLSSVRLYSDTLLSYCNWSVIIVTDVPARAALTKETGLQLLTLLLEPVEALLQLQHCTPLSENNTAADQQTSFMSHGCHGTCLMLLQHHKGHHSTTTACPT
jgi:hypothetical protein